MLLIASGCTQAIYTSVAANGGDDESLIVPASPGAEEIVQQPAQAAEVPADPPENDSKIKAVLKSLGETDKLIASFAGKIVVVDLWALW
jgi:hypothetical protein